jgi:hypothetical protein
MAEHLQLPTEMMLPDAGLHPDQASLHVGKPRFHLAARALLSQHNRTALVVAYDVERSIPITATALLSFCGMACSLSWRPPPAF